jgi:hypothetical protein
MVTELTYLIRFPLGFNSNFDPEFLFIKRIYSDIKKYTCLSKETKCSECLKKDKCIYYLLSGENFDNYPSILIKRSIVNKTCYLNNETLQLKVYLIGIANSYCDFITEFFQTNDYLNNNYFQKVLKSKGTTEDEEEFSGLISFNTVVQNIDDVILCINYYNQRYNTHFDIPSFNETMSIKKLKDTKKYIINGKIISYYGELFNCNVVNYPLSLKKAGVGKIAIIGGGCADES